MHGILLRIPMSPKISYCHLPIELITEILLLRLPVNSLLRFKSVCKQWLGIITSISFMHDHFHRESNRVSLLVHWSGKCTRENLDDVDVHSFILYTDDALEHYEEPDHIQLPGLTEAIVGPCNGVFCVTNTCNKLALWNPSTRKMRPLPSPKRFNINEEIGFGVDPFTNEFKIVLIHSAPHFSIFTLNNDSWRYFEDEALLKDSSLSIIECGTTFSKGVYYWRKYNRKNSTSVILAFDMCREVFQEIEMPNGISNEFFQETMLNEDGSIKPIEGMPSVHVAAKRRAILDLFDDSLAMFCYEHDINVCAGNHVDVWVMKEHGSWIRTFSIQVPFYLQCPLGFWMANHILFSKWDDSVVNEELVMYDLESGHKRLVRVPVREDAHGRKFWVFNYKKSLFPVKGRNGIQDYETQSTVSRAFFSKQ